eukprot:TRINITY_DN3817_c0_g1_i1.p1 TRINITY_DN3817_c0_g1~~TRINITY_DN3817_c0_g1_i1.p1  ORF type:complete len:463 (-),score=98.73 TRINITY_DN3817_c0_g1_i1:212-1600(-)
MEVEVDKSVQLQGMIREHAVLIRLIETKKGQLPTLKGSEHSRIKGEIKVLESIKDAFSEKLLAKRMEILQEYRSSPNAVSLSRSHSSTNPTQSMYSTVGRTKRPSLKDPIQDFKMMNSSPKTERKRQSLDPEAFSRYSNPSMVPPMAPIEEDEAADLASKLLGLGLIPSSDGSTSSIVRDFAVRADVNKPGLQRGKKEKSRIMTEDGTIKTAYQMEDDSISICPFNDDVKSAFFGVLDGHAGAEAVKAAKEIFPSEFINQLAKEPSPLASAAGAFKRSFIVTDEVMDDYQYEGCTATMAYLWTHDDKRFLQVANVGDSEAWICRDGVAVSLSENHKVTNPVEQARLTKDGVHLTPGQTRINGMAVSRSLGDRFLKTDSGIIATPYISELIELQPTDSFMIIASDGLWDVLSGKRAVELLIDETCAADMAKKLLDTALLSHKCHDNVTVLVICFNMAKRNYTF